MFPEGIDMSGLLEQAQAMQAQFQKAQEDLAAASYTGSVGGGLVEATVSGTGVLTGLTIKPETIDPDDPEGLADLVVAAVRAATEEANKAAAKVMPQMPNLGL